MSRIVIFDGNYTAYRAKYTTGKLTNGITFGIMRIAKAVVDEFKPQRVVFTFDQGLSKKRVLAYPKYKATRFHVGGFNQEVDMAKKMLYALGVDSIQIQSGEADDIIGVLSQFYSEVFDEVIIVGSDYDLYQLITDKVVVFNPIRRIRMDKTAFMNEFQGLVPKQIIDVKAIMGDTSDNIEGIPGIGEKGALKAVRMITSVKSLPNESLNQDKKLKKINEFVDIVNRNYGILTIPTEIKDLDDGMQEPMTKALILEQRSANYDEFQKLLKDFNFKSMNADSYVKSFSFSGASHQESVDGWIA